MLEITRESARQIFLGSSLLATGGGLKYDLQSQIFEQALADGRPVRVATADDLGIGTSVCGVYVVGSACAVLRDLDAQIERGMDLLSKITRRTYAALFPGETGIESVAFYVAQHLGIAVLDADAAGGRAVPQIQVDNFFVLGRRSTPLVAVTADGDAVALMESSNPAHLEAFVRHLAVASKASTIVFDHPLAVEDVARSLTIGRISRALALGRIIESAGDGIIAALADTLQGRVLIDGEVSECRIFDNPQSGFLEGQFSVKGAGGLVASISVKNENIICKSDQEVHLTVPDLIIAVDHDKGCGLHNSEIAVGRRVSIIGAPASSLWRSEAGQNVFNPRNLGYECDVRLL